MKHKSGIAVFACGVVGNLIYLWGVYRWDFYHIKDVDVVVNTVVMAVAIGLLIFHAETNAVAMNKKRAWGLCGLLGLVGWGLLYLTIRPGGQNMETVSIKVVPAPISTPGKIAAVVIVLCWVSAVMGLVAGMPLVSKVSSKLAMDNERSGYLNIRKIAEAQTAYWMTDWDGDGRNTYALFLPHLWKTVDGRAESIKTGLLPKALSFALNEKHALKGYYYINTLVCENSTPMVRSDDPVQPPSPSGHKGACFSIIAIPSVCGETGQLAYKTNQTGHIFALVVNKENIPSDIMDDVSSIGWMEVPSLNDLKALQKKIHEPI